MIQENPASNLLSWEVSKKRWLCAKGEPSCSVVLQLTKAVKISAIHIGAHNAAFVEVLVGRSEKPNEPFQVLLPSSVFLSPSESRRAEGVERVRSFSEPLLTGAGGAQRWDRVRLVCSQPYNKHCKYGLSFVQIYEPESLELAMAPSPGGSSEDEFKPGELFAAHRNNSQQSNSDTGCHHSPH
ncbi:unnamed protein product [Diatraea saccharalis]|uniref:DNA-repair protein Xrcc1 N-terminal domain-containing protein n=1 Tax=Diatraea saccharalis TaxID=40085 RepID=A0A9N9WBI8_9NEOP|nr:unnamed protein product [Diatraea saccharalis]